ncbi:MAG TPA: hypothetical protein VJT33_10625 [bacterium]|nr:hypothetical protein [bacterium]
MRSAIAVLIAVFVSLLGFNGVGHAQTLAEIQGTLETVDCQNGTVTTTDASGNTETIYASDSTAVAVQSSSVDFCSLDGYVGAPVDVWVVPDGNEFVATQIDVTGPVPVLASTQTTIAPMPIAGVVLGTILVGGLLYLIAHDGAAYYRYPYYGGYYHHYYNARYRPYTGWYPASAPIIYVATPLFGIVLGIVTVNNYEYLAVRDRDGAYQRYPYYGPYRSYYYHPTYRPYTGTYANVYERAPLSIGDSHWDAPQHQMLQFQQTITSRPSAWSAPHRPLPASYERPQWQPQAQPVFQRPVPAPQPQQARPASPRPQWQPRAQPANQHPQPVYQRPQPQPQQTPPAYQRPQWQPQAQPAYQRPQPQQTPPAYQRPQWQPQAQPPAQRPQPQPQRPQPQHVQPPRGNGGGQGQSPQRQQCDPRSNQGCSQPER